MSYVVIIDNPRHIDGEERIDIHGTESLEKYTDSRILRIYGKAKRIYKLYDNYRCAVLKEEE